MEICILWKKSTGTSPFLETTFKLTPQVKKVWKVMIEVKSHQGTIIRDEVWILFELFLEPPVSC